MSLKQIKSPRSIEQERATVISQKQFMGSIKDIPLAEIPDNYVYRNINVYSYGNWSQARPGTRLYSDATLPKLKFTVSGDELVFIASHGFATGDKIGFYSTGQCPSPLNVSTQSTYYAIKTTALKIKVASSYAEAIAGTFITILSAGTGTLYCYYKGDLNSILDHKEQKLVVKHYGTKVFISNRSMDSYTEVVNTSTSLPTDDDSMIASYEKSAIIACGSIYKIILDMDYYWMFKINMALCDTLITDIPSDVSKIYVYRYVYSQAILSGDGVRSRISDPENVLLLYETGVAQKDGEDKNFGECAFDTAIGTTGNHVVSYLTLPIANQPITHFSVYRTKNLGSTTNGAGNNSAYYVWVNDVAVAKAFIMTVSSNTITSTEGDFEEMDVGETIIGIDDAGNVKTGTISAYTASNTVTLEAGHSFVGATTYYSAVGGGRIMRAKQRGNMVALFSTGNVFVSEDVGRNIYWSDGSVSLVKKYIDQYTVEVADSDVKSDISTITMQRTSGTYAFRRSYNDTIIDDGVEAEEVGLVERMLSSQQLYIPQVNFRPIPDSNIVAIESGIAIFANRDEAKYYYSGIGAKSYIIGYHRLDVQSAKLHVGIRCIKSIPGKFVLFAVSKTYIINVSIPVESGNKKLGEQITKIVEATEADGEIGVSAWQTICPVNSMLYIAVTNEPAVRMFDGNSWGKSNLAITNGMPAMVNELIKMDNYYKINAWYSHLGGYKIFATKWVENSPGGTVS